MRKKILIGLAVLAGVVAVFLVYVALQPPEYHIERSATMAAPPDVIFGHINDLRKWEAWSPWAKLDPNAKRTFAGPGDGEGSSFTWNGNDKMGEGTLTILESRPHEFVRMQLEFVRPMQDTATTDFLFKPEGDGTRVTWTMDGENNFVERIFCTFMNLDKLVGGDYEKGLASIKEIVEAEAAAETAKPEPSGADTDQ